MDRNSLCRTVLVLAVVLVGGGAGSAARAATFVVNTSDDLNDAVCNAAHCSLREAINAANADAVADVIEFDIPGAGVHTISPTMRLPQITQPVTIDGFTQPGASANTQAVGSDAVMLIELDGTNAGLSPGIEGFTSGCTIRGLVVNRFQRTGISFVLTSNGNTIVGNYVGTDPTGTIDLGNGENGILLFQGPAGNTIGGPTPADRNLVSGNGNNGIYIQDAGTGNTVQNNYVGVDASGDAALGNGANGIVVQGTASTQVGGTGALEGNLVSGNLGSGMRIGAAGADDNVVEGNRIGTDIGGVDALPNAANGVFLFGGATGNRIGGVSSLPNLGPSDSAGNLISGNGGIGVSIANAGTSNNLVQGNVIGLDALGMTALPNGSHGVRINQGAGNVVGGTAAGLRNTISGNLGSGVVVTGAGADANVVQGNYLGTDLVGTAAIGNALHGAAVSGGATATLVGGAGPGEGNLISGNGEHGVQIGGAATTGTQVAGNTIGIDFTGTAALGNTLDGVHIMGGASGNTVGGAAAGAGNLIVANQGGVVAEEPATTGNVVQGNLIGVDPTVTAGFGNAQGVRLFDGASAQVAGNRILGNAVGVLLEGGGQTEAGSTGNCVVFNADGMIETGGATFESAWWGAADGPSGAGPGSGDTVTAGVDFDPFLVAAPAGCPTYGEISGTKFRDLTADGFSGDDPPLAGVTIVLWLDGGNGTFDGGGGDDTMAATGVSAVGTGAYRFGHLLPGNTYFVAEDPADLAGQGLIQTDGGDDFANGVTWYTVTVADGTVAAGRDFANFVEADEADLSIAKTASAQQAAAGSTLTYTVTVTNEGPGSATGVVVTDDLPAGVTLVGTTGCNEDPNGVPTCTLGSIGPGSSVAYEIEVMIDDGFVGKLVNQVSVTGTSPDLDPANDADLATVVVGEPSILEIPTLDPVGLGVLVLTIVGGALLLLRRTEDLAGSGDGR